jgi:hypothetical protein
VPFLTGAAQQRLWQQLREKETSDRGTALSWHSAAAPGEGIMRRWHSYSAISAAAEVMQAQLKQREQRDCPTAASTVSATAEEKETGDESLAQLLGSRWTSRTALRAQRYPSHASDTGMRSSGVPHTHHQHRTWSCRPMLWR